MPMIALLLALAGGNPASGPQAIAEIRFASDRYCLPFSGVSRFQLEARDPKLIDLATLDAAAEGRRLVFQNAIARKKSGRAYYAFRLELYFDIYLVYETDPRRERLVRKFRYSAKAHACTLPWPPEK